MTTKPLLEAAARLEQDARKYFANGGGESPADVWGKTRDVDADEVEELADYYIKQIPAVRHLPPIHPLRVHIKGTLSAAIQSGFEAACQRGVAGGGNMSDKYDEAFRKEFEVDPSAPDPMSMLDVLEEAAKRSHRSRQAAVEMQAAVAIKAILDGADIHEVARKCGFSPDDSPIEDGITVSSMSDMYSWLTGRSQTPPSQAFAEWLGNTLVQIIQDKFKEKGRS